MLRTALLTALGAALLTRAAPVALDNDGKAPTKTKAAPTAVPTNLDEFFKMPANLTDLPPFYTDELEARPGSTLFDVWMAGMASKHPKIPKVPELYNPAVDAEYAKAHADDSPLTQEIYEDTFPDEPPRLPLNLDPSSPDFGKAVLDPPPEFKEPEDAEHWAQESPLTMDNWAGKPKDWSAPQNGTDAGTTKPQTTTSETTGPALVSNPNEVKRTRVCCTETSEYGDKAWHCDLPIKNDGSNTECKQDAVVMDCTAVDLNVHHAASGCIGFNLNGGGVW